VTTQTQPFIVTDFIFEQKDKLVLPSQHLTQNLIKSL